MIPDKDNQKAALRRHALKRIGLAAGASALAMAAGSSMLTALTGCSPTSDQDTDRQKITAPPASYSNSFPAGTTQQQAATPTVEENSKPSIPKPKVSKPKPPVAVQRPQTVKPKEETQPSTPQKITTYKNIQYSNRYENIYTDA